jgi:hypothetical protein
VPSLGRNIALPSPSVWYVRSIAVSLLEPKLMVQSLGVTVFVPGRVEPKSVTLAVPVAQLAVSIHEAEGMVAETMVELDAPGAIPTAAEPITVSAMIACVTRAREQWRRMPDGTAI